MHTPLPLPRDPRDVPRAFVRAFDSGDLDTLLALYGTDSVLAPMPHEEARGADIGPALRRFMASGARLQVQVRRCLQAGDAALLILDWRIHGATGSPAGQSGTAADVVLRRPDGSWGYGIDNPFGVL
jgi:ketosteroid isomerase-like protein